MSHKAIKFIIPALLSYLSFPVIAGMLAIGDRDGPKIYPKSYHTILYMVSYEAVRNEKPRENPFYDRPWFYGLPRKRVR